MAIAAIKAILASDSDVTGQVGTKIFKDVAHPGASYPYLILKTETVEHLQGHSGSSGLRHEIVSVTCWAEDSEALDTLVGTNGYVRLALQGVNGTYGGKNVHGIVCLPDIPLETPPTSGKSLPRQRGRELNFSIWLAEAKS